MQNKYALSACRAPAATRALKTVSDVNGHQSPARQVVQLVRLRRAKVGDRHWFLGFSTGAETCTSSATAEPVSRKRRTIDLGETKAGSWGCVGLIRLWSLTLRLCWSGMLTNTVSQRCQQSE